MRRALCLAALLLASCGGGATAPSPVAVSPVLPVSLPSGSYTLTLTMAASGLPTCKDGLCTSISLCVGTPDAAPARIAVQVAGAGSDVTITAGGGAKPLTMTLQTASVPASGAVSGSASDARGMTVEATGTLTAFGSANAAVAASGTLDGQVAVNGSGCSNNGHTWTLARN